MAVMGEEAFLAFLRADAHTFRRHRPRLLS
jgi:hypothetical protein